MKVLYRDGLLTRPPYLSADFHDSQRHAKFPDIHVYCVHCLNKKILGLRWVSTIHLYLVIHFHTSIWDDMIWKHFPRYWPFVSGIHRSPVYSPHKAQWRGALIVSLICAWTNGWTNHWDVGGLRRHSARYAVTVMIPWMVMFSVRLKFSILNGCPCYQRTT